MNIISYNSIQCPNFGAYRVTNKGLSAINNLKDINYKSEFEALFSYFKNTKYANLFVDTADSFCSETGNFITEIVPYLEIPEKLGLPLHKYIKNIGVKPYYNSNYNLWVYYTTIQNKSYSSVLDFPYSIAKQLKAVLNMDNCVRIRRIDNIRTFGDAIEQKFLGIEPSKPELSLSERLNEKIDTLFREQNYQ